MRKTPRPTSTPLTPLARRSMICSGSTQSPLPRTGMSRLPATCETSSQSASPLYDCSAVQAVNRHRCCAGVLHHAREQRGVSIAIAPSGAHLHGHWNLHCLGHRANDARRVAGIAHQTASSVVLRDFRDRTSHVDVHDVRPHPFDDLRGIGHLDRIASEDLDRDWAFFLGVSAYSNVRSMPRTRPSDETISVTTRPQPPCRLTRRRNAVSVMPAIGATTNGEVNSTEPIFIRDQ